MVWGACMTRMTRDHLLEKRQYFIFRRRFLLRSKGRKSEEYFSACRRVTLCDAIIDEWDRTEKAKK